MSEPLRSSKTRRPLRILLADDHDILRQGLKLLLGLQPDLEVIGEARTGQEAVASAEELQPDVVLLDISMPKMDGFEACRLIRERQPDTYILILTMHESEEYFLQALRMGASGYIIKKAAPTDLITAVRTVAQGEAFLYPGLAKALVRAYVNQPNPSNNQREKSSLAHELEILTPREMEVLRLVAEGKTNQEIADLLVLSIKTIQAHRANVMEKLGLQNVTHLVRFAIQHGLLPPTL
ncbi:MAG TPA: response regulator transcription factor [Ktedonobacteraceae bacterium]|nr:response regulator transcription factor [Ktedonobacteraceae bacterium]